MGMIYTSLPLSDPTRQRYQRIIDNSSALISKRWGRDGNRQSGNTVIADWAKTLNNMYSNGINRYSPYGNTYSGWDAIENAFNRKQAASSNDQASGKGEEPLSAVVRNGKIVGSRGSNQNEAEDSLRRKGDNSLDEENQKAQQTNLMDLYNLMRGDFYGSGFGNNYYGWL